MSTSAHTHECIKVEQHVALPGRFGLSLGGAFRVDAVPEQEQRLVVLALLELGDHVGNGVRGEGWLEVGGREPETQAGRAIVDDERRVGSPVGVVGVGR